MGKKKLFENCLLFLGCIGIVLIFRIIPHPPNFTPVIALSLYPFIIGISMFLGVLGGYVACVYGGWTSSSEFIGGIQLDFIPFHVTYAFIKTAFFSFILATIPSYHGYFMKGGALQVGKASTTSFVWTSVTIIIVNYLITQSLLA